MISLRHVITRHCAIDRIADCGTLSSSSLSPRLTNTNIYLNLVWLRFVNDWNFLKKKEKLAGKFEIRLRSFFRTLKSSDFVLCMRWPIAWALMAPWRYEIIPYGMAQ
jgi:hypothetical protein